MQPLLPKNKVAEALLTNSYSMFVHLDPRGEDVIVPSWFKNQAQLVLQIGMNMEKPIPDLTMDSEGISCTLSFNNSPVFCSIPWSSIYCLVDDDGKGMVWPTSVPKEVIEEKENPRSETEADNKESEPKKTKKKLPPYLRVVK